MKKLVTLVAVVCSTLLVAQTGDSLKSKECHKDKKECSSKKSCKKDKKCCKKKNEKCCKKKDKKECHKEKVAE